MPNDKDGWAVAQELLDWLTGAIVDAEDKAQGIDQHDLGPHAQAALEGWNVLSDATRNGTLASFRDTIAARNIAVDPLAELAALTKSDTPPRAALDTIREQLEWRGPNGGKMGHVVIPREIAEAMLAYKLPCDVQVPPNTIIRKGCGIEQLMVALAVRERWPEDRHTFVYVPVK